VSATKEVSRLSAVNLELAAAAGQTDTRSRRLNQRATDEEIDETSIVIITVSGSSSSDVMVRSRDLG